MAGPSRATGHVIHASLNDGTLHSIDIDVTATVSWTGS